MKKLRLVSAMSREAQLMLVEAYLLLGWARLLKLVPFSKLANKLGDKKNESPFEYIDDHRKILKQISQIIHLASRYTFWESECLVKAIAARKMLDRRGITSTLYLGVGRVENAELVAHAWLRSGPFYVTGSEGMERFTVVARFSNHGIPLRRKLNEK
jgi:hypothetical protein